MVLGEARRDSREQRVACATGVEAEFFELPRFAGSNRKAFGIDGRSYGVDLCKHGRLYLLDGPGPKKIGRSTRIGVEYAGDWAKKQWRFFDPESAFVSRSPSAAGNRKHP